MKKVQVTSKGEAKRVMYFKEVTHLDVFRTEQVEELERGEFTVYVNMLKNFPFQFDLGDDCLYIDIEDVEANTQQLDKLAELVEGKSKEEEKEIMQENYIEFVKRQAVYTSIGDKSDIIAIITDFITDHNI